MKIKRGCASLLALCLTLGCATQAFAQTNNATINGLWRPDAKSIISITANGAGELTGNLAWVEGKSQSSVNAHCAGNPKLLGQTILSLQPDAAVQDQWTGTLVDPKTCKKYSVVASLTDKGAELHLHISTGLLSANKVWKRAPDAALAAYSADQLAPSLGGLTAE